MLRGCLILAGLIVLPLLGESAMAQEMRPGQYRVTTTGTITQAGVAMAMPESTMDICFSPEQARQAMQPAPPPDQTGCNAETLGQADGSRTMRMTCPNVVVDTSITWTPDGYHSVSRTKMIQDGQEMLSDMTVTAQRLGDCQ